MGSIRIYKGMPFTKEDLECLAELEKMTDEDIDYSDIPKMTKEELQKFKPARLRKKKFESCKLKNKNPFGKSRWDFLFARKSFYDRMILR